MVFQHCQVPWDPRGTLSCVLNWWTLTRVSTHTTAACPAVPAGWCVCRAGVPAREPKAEPSRDGTGSIHDPCRYCGVRPLPGPSAASSDCT